MRRQLVSSAHAGESVTRVAERLLDIDKPIVRLPQHVQELRDAAQMALHRGDRNIYLDAVKKWQGTVERLGQGPEGGAGAHTMRSATQQLVKDLGVAKADQLDHVVDRWVVERARHQARVIARTETVEAFRDVYKETTAKQPYVVGYRWQLSGGHARSDECDVYAGQDVDGLGPGGYLPENIPSTPHPHDLCAQVAILDKDYFKRELAKTNGTEEPPKPWESGKTELGATWLKKQPEALQKQVLGPTLHRLFTAGKNVLDASGKPLPVHVVLGRDKPVRRLGQKVDATGAVQRDRRGQVKPFPSVPGASNPKPTRARPSIASGARPPEPKARPASTAIAAQRQTPEYWLQHGLEKRYGDEVGRAVAWGRAAEHRGRAIAAADAHTQLDALAKAGIATPQVGETGVSALAWTQRVTGRDFASIGEAIEHLEANPSDGSAHLVTQLRVSASLIGHANSIRRSEKPIAVAIPLRTADAVLTKELANGAALRARSVYHALSDATIVHPSKDTHDFRSTAQKRGQYRAPQQYVRGHINLGEHLPEQNRFVDETAVHEWGHALENLNPKLRARAREYLARRTHGEALVKLRDHTGIAEYGDRELARPDELFHPYMGKEYPTDTEITSMLTQQLVKDGGLTRLLAADPDSFHFLLGQLSGAQ